MSVAAVTMVRNEVDIIDTFVGYHHELVDHHLILDTGSTDGTRDRLVDLTGRLVGLEVRFQDLPAFEQASVVSSMAREVVRTQGVDFVVPLDCDEFLSRTEGPIARGWEADLPLSVVSAFRWATYVPDVEVTTDRPVIAQITKRREDRRRSERANVIVPAEVVRVPPDSTYRKAATA